MTHTLEEILDSPYFFEAPTDETCYHEGCDKVAFGVLYLWYDGEDDACYLPYYCKEHLLEIADNSWGDSL